MLLVLDKSKELQSEGGRPESIYGTKFDQLGAQINSWHVFHCKSNTFALVACFLPSVLGETGVGAVSMSLLVLGPA